MHGFGLYLLLLATSVGAISDIFKWLHAMIPPWSTSVCYNTVGCFSQDPPWSSPIRLVPPPMPPVMTRVRAHCYTRFNPHKPYIMDTYPRVIVHSGMFNGTKPTLIILHGYSSSVLAKWMYLLRDVYLEKTDGNVLILDWTMAAVGHLYFQSVANIRVVARLTGNLIRHLVRHHSADLGRIHIMGSSLGAHLASLIAKDLPGIAWVTGIDPAQPLFETAPPEVRLTKSDALFVDVLHTSARSTLPYLGFGIMAPVGHVDFYFNGGTRQPGCQDLNVRPMVHGTTPLDWYPAEIFSGISFFCNHIRSQMYLIEAYNETNGCVYWGRRAVYAGEEPGTILGRRPLYKAVSERCTSKDCVALGLRTNLTPLRGIFEIRTKRNSPFCLSVM